MEGERTDGAQKGRKRDEKSVFSGSSSRVRARSLARVRAPGTLDARPLARFASSREKKREAPLLFSPRSRGFPIFRVYLC